MKSSTQTDTINFVYNELSKSDCDNYLKQLDTNEATEAYFTSLIDMMMQLDTLTEEPSDECIANILEYASKNLIKA